MLHIIVFIDIFTSSALYFTFVLDPQVGHQKIQSVLFSFFLVCRDPHWTRKRSGKMKQGWGRKGGWGLACAGRGWAGWPGAASRQPVMGRLSPPRFWQNFFPKKRTTQKGSSFISRNPYLHDQHCPGYFSQYSRAHFPHLHLFVRSLVLLAASEPRNFQIFEAGSRKLRKVDIQNKIT